MTVTAHDGSRFSVGDDGTDESGTQWWTGTRYSPDDDDDIEATDSWDSLDEMAAAVAEWVGYGTLVDYTTGTEIGSATQAHRVASDEAGENGVFTVDRDGDPCSSDADPAVYGPLRTVYVQP